MMFRFIAMNYNVSAHDASCTFSFLSSFVFLKDNLDVFNLCENNSELINVSTMG